MVKIEQVCGVITAGTQCSAIPHSSFIIDVPIGSCIARWNMKEKKRIFCFQAHSESLICVKKWNDLICTGSFAADLKLWTSDWKLLDTVEKAGEKHIVYASWNNEGSLLATCHRDETVKIWKINQETKKIEFHCKLEGHFGYACEWWSNSHLLLSPMIELEKELPKSQKRIIRVNQELILFNVQTNSLETNVGVSFPSPSELVVTAKSGTHIALGMGNGNVFILSCGDNTKEKITLQIETILLPCKYRIRALAFSLDGSKLLTPGGEGVIQVYSPSTGKLVHSIPGPNGNIIFLAFCLDNEKYIWYSNEFSLGYVDASLETTSPYVHHTHELTANAIDWHEDGKWLVSGDLTGNVFLWDIPSAEDSHLQMSLTDPKLKTKVEGDSIRAIAFCPSDIFVYYGTMNGDFYSWNLETKETKLETTLDGAITCIRWFNSFVAASTTQGTIYLFSKLKIRDSSLQLIDSFPAADRGLEIWSLVFSPDGKYLATASEDTTASVWTLKGKQTQHLKGHVNAVTCIDWQSTDVGEILATCSDDRTVRVYNSQDNFSLYHIFQASDLYITYLALERISSCIAATTEDGYIYVFCLKKKENLSRKKLHSGSVEGLRTHPTSSRFATCSSDCTILISSIPSRL